jgi:hypothetical protein
MSDVRDNGGALDNISLAVALKIDLSFCQSRNMVALIVIIPQQYHQEMWICNLPERWLGQIVSMLIQESVVKLNCG